MATISGHPSVKSALLATRTGFLGVAEMLVRLKLLNGRIVEYPAVLESRILGESKMKIVRTIMLHLRFLVRLTLQRSSMREESRPMRVPEKAPI